MKLISCRLSSVRRHQRLTLAFAPGLTLITGANESGKSSLVEALHRTLFLRATATGAPVQRLRSLLHSGHPEVELQFDARGRRWTLQKRFSGQSGTTTLTGAGEPPRIGSEAEDQLASLLGVDDIVGSRQAGRVLPSRWAHLWVMQGDAGRDLLQLGGDHYDLRGLIAQLEEQADAALQSPFDQHLHDQLSQLVSASVTSRGVRQQSRLWQCEQTLRERQQQRDDAEAELVRYEQASTELDALDDALRQLQHTQLPQLKRARKHLQERHKQQDNVLAERKALHQQLKPLRHQHQQLVLHHRRLQQTEQALSRQRDALKRVEEKLQRLSSIHQDAAAAVEQQKHQLQECEQERTTLELRGHQLRRMEEQLQLGERLLQLQRQQGQLQHWQQQHQELSQALKTNDAPGLEELRDLQAKQRQLDAVAIRLDAMASVVTLEHSDQEVTLDGTPLQKDVPQRRASTFCLTIGEGVKLQIAPGGGEGLEALHQEQTTLQKCINARLQAWNSDTLEQLALRSQQRQELLTRQTLLLQQRPDSLDGTALRQEQHSLEERLAQLAQEMADQPNDPKDREQIQQDLAQCRQRYRTVSDHAKTLRGNVDKTEQQIKDQDQQRQTLQLQREALVAETRSLDQQRLDLLHDHGGEPDLLEALQQYEAQIKSLDIKLKTLDDESSNAHIRTEDIPKQLQDLDQQERLLQQRLQDLSAERGALVERNTSLGQNDPYGSVEAARTRLAQAERAQHAETLQVQAHQHLLGLFEAARSDLSSRYTAPLSRSISNFLTPLMKQPQESCQLNYSAKQGLGNLTLQRGNLELPFANLSGGMKEQLNAAMRLAMADTLRVGHDGCLPLLFDDAFTNTDPERLEGVMAMLQQAVANGLQVVVLSCDGHSYRSFADAVVELD